MVDDQRIDIKFEEEAEGWRAADLMPGEGCIYNGIVYIKLGFSTVELHTSDEHRMTPGEVGVNKKKHFFFQVDNASVTTLQGETLVAPAKIEVIVRRTTLRGSTISDTMHADNGEAASSL